MSASPQQALDPVTLEVLRNALPAVTNEMSVDLQRASYNMMIYEIGDFSCAIVAANGELISQNVGGVSHFVADLGVIIKDGVERYGTSGFAPGDVLITNHQRVAGQHLNNIVVYVPIFHEQRLVAFAMVRAHWIDVGGLSTGFGVQTVLGDPWSEGLQLDQLKIYGAGEPNETLFAIIRDNVRFADAALGDLRAQIAACRLGAKRTEELYERYGGEVIDAGLRRIFEQAELRCRSVVETIPDGEYEAASFLDHDGFPADGRVELHARVTVAGSDMTIDFSGCSPQRRSALNARTLAGAMVAYKCLTTPHEPMNEGSFRAVRVVIPEGNMMMARFPAPMAGWSVALPTVIDTVFKALSDAIPERIPAAHLGSLGGAVIFIGQRPLSGERFVVQSLEGGGWGGRPHEDGPSASLSVCQGDVRNSPIESIELRCPVLVEQRALRTDSGGAGRHRGGLGLDVTVRNFVAGRWNAWTAPRRGCPPWGLRGGQPGEPGGYLAKRPQEADFEARADVVLYEAPPGTRVTTQTAGGGGWGEPFERDPDAVAADVREGYVSREAAARDYGVVLAGTAAEVDVEATARMRR